MKCDNFHFTSTKQNKCVQKQEEVIFNRRKLIKLIQLIPLFDKKSQSHILLNLFTKFDQHPN